MSRVLVAHRVSKSRLQDGLQAAERFGQLEYVNQRYVYSDEISGGNELPFGFRNNIQAAVDNFNPEWDYLLLVGDHWQVAALTALLAQRYDRFRVLRWDHIARGYVPAWIGGTVPDLRHDGPRAIVG